MSLIGLRHYLGEIRTYPLLTREEEQEVGRNLTGTMDDAARRMVVSNLRFVAKIAAHYRDMGVALEDLIGEGNLGLMQAAMRFDPSLGFKFTTYASWWIKKSIRAALQRGASQIRVPAYRLRKHGNGEDGVLASGDPRRRTRSLSDPVGSGPVPCMGDLLAETGYPDPEEAALRRDRVRVLLRIWPKLDARERMIVAGRFGLMNEKAQTLRELGGKLGLTRERVRQIEKEAIAKLRKELEPLLGLRSVPPPALRARRRAA